MIPRIIHQIWVTGDVPPEFRAWTESWEKRNPGWQRMFWDDRRLLDFVARHYASLLPVYCGYKEGVMRVDMARCMLLHHFGGVYADIDCECVASLEALVPGDRIVISREPDSHWPVQGEWRGLPYILFNGTMASPKGHPFWKEVLDLMVECRSAGDVLDATGPCLLTSAQLRFSDQSAFEIRPSHIFTPLDNQGNADPATEGETLSIHHWAGTWWTPRRDHPIESRIKTSISRLAYRMTRGPQFDAGNVISRLASLSAGPPPPKDGQMAIFIPVRNCAAHLPGLARDLAGLDLPARRKRLVFCEGDSEDDSKACLAEICSRLSVHFDEVVVLNHDVGSTVTRRDRAVQKLQRDRRSRIASVRNHMVSEALMPEDDWVLWVDADLWHMPAHVVGRLLDERARIVVPHCVKWTGGPTYDMNSFVTRRDEKDYRYYRHVRRGLYLPPPRIPGRRHLSDLRHLDRVTLDAVGGTMLLIDANLHRAGLIFPEEPFNDLIETEGLGAVAAAAGIRPVGLPRVEIVHGPW